MSFENLHTLQCETRKGILLITINREEKLNSLNRELIRELGICVDEVYANSSIRGVIITGKGQKAFAAGADISEFSGLSRQDGENLARKGHDLFHRIELAPKPFIAAVNGFALGGGCELAMACHLRIASENAKFGQPEVNLGLIPGYGGTQRLVQLIGKGNALELLLTGDSIDATTACKLGLVNRVVLTVELIDVCMSILDKITAKAPLAIAKTIECVHAHFKDGIDGFDTEIVKFGECIETQDFLEGTKAFMEKRKATFLGK